MVRIVRTRGARHYRSAAVDGALPDWEREKVAGLYWKAVGAVNAGWRARWALFGVANAGGKIRQTPPDVAGIPTLGVAAQIILVLSTFCSPANYSPTIETPTPEAAQLIGGG